MVTVGVRLPCFRLAAALRHTLAPDAAAYLIERTRRRVVEATDVAERAGVRPGISLRDATRLLPRGAVVLEDPARSARTWRRVLDVLARLPAPVDDGGPGFAFVRIPRGDRPERWFRRVRDRLEPLGLTVRCGAGANGFIAFAATHRAADAICSPGREAAFLADAPLELLGIDGDTALRLRLLGVRTVGGLAALPPAYLRRFGGDAQRFHEFARGPGDAQAGLAHPGARRDRG
jgi:nucleotidyltransferase/DNA polymerase involved in DNA repair